MIYIYVRFNILMIILFFSLNVHSNQGKKSYVYLDYNIDRSIQGVLHLDRKKYFNVCDSGVGFDQRIDQKSFDTLVLDYNINFGRNLGLVKWWTQQVEEDINRPGYANIEPLKNYQTKTYSDTFINKCGPSLDISCHGVPNSYPEFMGKYTKDIANHNGKQEWLPENIDAASEFAAAVLKHTFSSFDRPVYYEPVNEPHWAFWTDTHFANWHLKMKERVHESVPGVLVGGPCFSVAYFYRDDYKIWNSFKTFVDKTNGELDFYSFHAYDFFTWKNNDFVGRIQSGLPLEGVLDLVQNYMVNSFSEEKKLVFSEHGGYIIRDKGIYDGESTAAKIASQYFPGKTFTHEMKKRSIVNSLMLQATIANTLTFLDHPHVIQKAVPFLLPNSWEWDEKYYAQLFVPDLYTDQTTPVPTHLINFFRFFRDVKGRRVKAICNDPDIQTRAFVDKNKLFLILNNLSANNESLTLYGLSSTDVQIRRIGRNKDFSGRYNEENITLPNSPQILKLNGYETAIVVVEFDEDIKCTSKINEVICYGDRITVPASEATFKIKTPKNQNIEYATLRIGLTRNINLEKTPELFVNGNKIELVEESCAERLEDKEYATTKIVMIDPKILKETNIVDISFSDEEQGVIGSVVLRVAVKD